jgi:hypothetical protein
VKRDFRTYVDAIGSFFKTIDENFVQRAATSATTILEKQFFLLTTFFLYLKCYLSIGRTVRVNLNLNFYLHHVLNMPAWLYPCQQCPKNEKKNDN